MPDNKRTTNKKTIQKPSEKSSVVKVGKTNTSKTVRVNVKKLESTFLGVKGKGVHTNVPGILVKKSGSTTKPRFRSSNSEFVLPMADYSKIWYMVFSIKPTDHVPDTMKLIHLIREGVPGKSVALFADALQVSKNEVYRLLHMNPRTAQRVASGTLDVEKSDHLVQITKVYQRCLEVFEDKDRAMRWLKSPNYALGDQSPWALLDTSEGIELVQDTLVRIEYGVFA